MKTVMAKSFLKLDTRRKMDDGTYPVKIAVSYGTNLYLSTGISVSKDAWNQEAGKVVAGNARRLNDTLSTLLCRVQNEVLALRESGRFYDLSRKRLKEILECAGTLTSEDKATRSEDIFKIADSFLATKMGNRTIEL